MLESQEKVIGPVIRQEEKIRILKSKKFNEAAYIRDSEMYEKFILTSKKNKSIDLIYSIIIIKFYKNIITLYIYIPLLKQILFIIYYKTQCKIHSN